MEKNILERERVTISMKTELIKRIDEGIDGVVVRNRSHAVENMIIAALGGLQNKNIVILVGGKEAQKNLPQVKKIIAQLKESEHEKIFIALGALAGRIKETLGNGSDLGLVLHYIEGGEGTGGALLPLKNIFFDTFIVINPSEKLPENLSNLLLFHKNRRVLATIATDNLAELKGVYIFEPQIFDFITSNSSMLEDEAFPALIQRGELAVYPLI